MKHQGKVTVIDSVVIRQERAGDFNEIKHLLKESFAGAEHTDGDEHNLVGRIRATDEYIPSLSLVAEINNEIVGYAMFSQIYIGKVKTIALAPFDVPPQFYMVFPFNSAVPQGTVRYSHAFD